MPILYPVTPTDTLTGVTKDLVDDVLIGILLTSLQKIKVHDEVGVPDSTRKIFTFTYQNWNENFTVEVTKNIHSSWSIMTNTDYTVDYVNGKITLNTAINVGDEVRASYQFRYFSRDELAEMIRQSLHELNGIPPKTGFLLDNGLPLEWNPTLAMRAYYYSLGRLLDDLSLWIPRLAFADPDNYRTYIQSKRTEADNFFKTNSRYLKRRSLIVPQSVTSGKFFTPSIVSSTNFRSFTILGSS